MTRFPWPLLATSTLLGSLALGSAALSPAPTTTSPQGVPTTPGASNPWCPAGISDQSSPNNCIQASSLPQLGSLYPLSERFYVDPAGGVGVGTTLPGANLEVRAAWNTHGWSQANIVSRSSGDTVGVGLYNDHRKWDIANIVSAPSGIDRFVIRDTTASKERLSITEKGRFGLGIKEPESNLEVQAEWNTQGWGQANIVSRYVGDTVGLGIYNDDREWDFANITSSPDGIDRFSIRDSTAGKTRFTIAETGFVGIGTLSPATTLDVNGAITIRGGSDLAEPFEVIGDDVRPGMVCSIDPAHIDRLQISRGAYDRKVAGVVSGAGDLDPGLVLSQGPAPADHHPVALSGRVWCYSDASFGSISAGDLLTTSPTPGHAMVATDAMKTHGAVLGKAISSLDEGRGLVLVLVSLQ